MFVAVIAHRIVTDAALRSSFRMCFLVERQKADLARGWVLDRLLLE